jgi:Gluconate 2-dehydrogenase subunit 3
MEKGGELRVLDGRDNGINRRTLVKRLLGGAGAGFAAPLLGASHPVHKHLADAATLVAADQQAAAQNWEPSFFDAHQNATLVTLAELIVPGATQAHVDRFIDLAAAAETQETQVKLIAALSAFDGEALQRFQRPYVALTAEQQAQILEDASTARPAEGEPHPADEGASTPAPKNPVTEQEPATLRDHFENLKQWVSGAYYSSEIGMKELGWDATYYYQSFPGCQHPEGHQ